MMENEDVKLSPGL